MKKFKLTKKKLLSFLFQILIMLIAIYGITKWQSRNLIPINDKAPNIELQTLSKESYSLNKINSKKTIIYFFSPWCSVCKFSSHNIVALRNSKTNKEMEIIAIALSWKDINEVKNFAIDHKLNVPILLGNSSTSKDFKIESFPTIYILDENKTIVDRVIGYTTEIGLRIRSL